MIIKLNDVLDLIDINRDSHEPIRLIIDDFIECTNTSSILLNGDILDRTVLSLGVSDNGALDIYLKEEGKIYEPKRIFTIFTTL